MPSPDKVRENKARRWAARLAHRLRRSRAKHLHVNDHGLYQLVDDRNVVVERSSFDASLDDIEAALQRAEAALITTR